MKILLALDRLLVRIETVFLVIFLSLMVILAFAQVVLRNVFGTGILWGDPVVRQMVMWSGFMGAAIAASQDRHINIDALTKFLKGRVKDIVHVITSLFASVVCFYMARAAWVFMQDDRESGSELIAGIPSWIGLTIIPLGFALLAIHFALGAIKHGGDAIAPPPTAEEAKP
jgi:TRAP-type C4-dicarboxylate transport system permease small subunit